MFSLVSVSPQVSKSLAGEVGSEPMATGSGTASGSAVRTSDGGTIVPIKRSEEPIHGTRSTSRLTDIDEWGRSDSLRAVARRVFKPMYDHYFRAEWEGLEKIPTEGGALLVANHAGAIPMDAPVIMHGIEQELNRPVYGLADHFFRQVPVVGTMWSRLGGVPAHPDNAYRLLNEQRQLAVVFPEGTKGTSKVFTQRYRLRRFGRGGFVEIAMRSGVPVVPIAVIGSEETMPIVFKVGSLAKLTGLPYFPVTVNSLLLGPLLGTAVSLPAKFKLRVLDPVHFNVPPDQERYSKSRIMDESENIRIQIQENLYDMLAHRGNPWTG